MKSEILSNIRFSGRLSAFLLWIAGLLLCMGATNSAARTIYTAKDSILVEQLLREQVRGNDVLHYARHFLGLPYVVHTLEVADPECLVVNLRELDCTTYVETVMALTMTHRQGGRTFADYTRNLQRLRYWNGRIDGYTSRLHYFTWWMHDNLRKGIFTEVTDERYFTAPLRVNNYYMSRHADAYKFLKGHPDRVDRIRVLERQYNGPDGHYLPARNVGLSAQKLSCIHDGDLVAIVTTKAGLDYSHLGIAVWGKDGRLHMLHASSAKKRVIEDTRDLRTYLSSISTSVGIRLLHLR